MSWFFLVIASCFEIAWVFALQRAQSQMSWIWGILCLASLLASVFFMALAMRQLPLGVVYAVWTGIGVLGAVSIGAVFDGEILDLPKLVCVGLIMMGVLGLKLQS